jgi:hypothetical protein
MQRRSRAVRSFQFHHAVAAPRFLQQGSGQFPDIRVLMTTAASAAIVIRIRAVNVYKFSLNFSKFS